MHSLFELTLILAGGAFTVAAMVAAGRMIAPRTAMPLSVRFVIGCAWLSVAIFLLLAANAGFRPLLIAGGAVTIVLGFRAGARSPRLPPLPALSLFHQALFGIAGLIYLIYALAPETSSDAAGFRLGLVSEYVRHHGLTRRVGFYELIPQSVEMLFVPAFMIGAHSAAKLVHFAFLLATIPLFRHIARELNVSDGAACTAAALFIFSPVAALTGTAAYTDLALVCANATVLYLLPRWNRERTTPLLVAAGLAAGLCYTIKLTFGPIVPVGMIYVAWRARRARPVMLFAAAAAVVVSPWIIRAYVLTGNPFAPVLNAWFPNDGIPPATDSVLLAAFSVFAPNFSWRTAWPDYTLFGGHMGVLGPAYVFLPLGLFALRSKSGRRLLAAALVLALPIIPNAGTRFLMPAMVPATLAFCSLLSPPVAAGFVALQTVGALRPVIRLYGIHEQMMLPKLPLRAALRIEPERAYLRRVDPLYSVDEMVVANTESDAKILVLGSLDQAYVPREIQADWHSTVSARISMNMFQSDQGYPSIRLRWRLPAGQYAAVRLTALKELKLLDESPLSPARLWPARSFLPGELWVTPIQPDQDHLDFLFNGFDPSGIKFEARTPLGDWKTVPADTLGTAIAIDLRRRTTADILAHGYRYILIPVASGFYADVAKHMEADPAGWGVSLQAVAMDQALFRISGEDPSAPLRRIGPDASVAWDRDVVAHPQPGVARPAAAITQAPVKAQPAVQPAIANSLAGPCDPAMIDDSGNEIQWHGRWTAVQNFFEACNGTLTYTNVAHSATFPFTGTSVTWVYAAASNGGRAEVWIDDHSAGVIDQYRPCETQEPGCVSIQWHSQVSFGSLAPGKHTIRIDVLHQKSPGSQDYSVNIDGFIVR